MNTFSFMTETIGPPIIKAILKYWLKNADPLIDAGEDILNALKTRIRDPRIDRELMRQFDSIQDRILDDLVPIFEGVDIDENEKESILLEVKATLSATELSWDEMIEFEFDQFSFYRHLAHTRPISEVTRDFSEAGAELYRRMLKEASSYIVNIAPKLPSFTQKMLVNLVKNDNAILESVEHILGQLKHIREESIAGNRSSDARLFEQNYRELIFSMLDEQQLFGIDDQSLIKRQRISVSFVSLTAQLQPLSDDDVSDVSSSRIESVLTESARLIISGSAGTGKTTLLKWIAVKSAEKGFSGLLTDWNGTVPFFIQLRQCIDFNMPSVEEFPGFALRTIDREVPNNWVNGQLEGGRAIVLIDGVDEVPSQYRDAVRLWLKELVVRYPNSRYIVTSRPYAIEEQWMMEEGFIQAELQEMDLSDIRIFIEYWHRAISDSIKKEDEIKEPFAYAEKLFDHLQHDRTTLLLARNPLLCALICAMNWAKEGRLPQNRLKLYEEGCKMLLFERDYQRSIDLSDQYPVPQYEQSVFILQKIAHYMLINGYEQISLNRAIDIILEYLPHLHTEGIIPQKVIGFFIDRTAILRKPQVDSLEFAHRAFHDYLTAKEVINKRNIGLLINKAHDDRWRELIIMAAGLADNPLKDRHDILDGLISKGDSEAENRHRFHLLAIACLEVCSVLDPELREKMEERLEALIPPRNMTEAGALASAGEIAVRYLSNHFTQRGPIAASCVRTLSIIGGNSALHALQNYRNDTRLVVVPELIRAAESFPFADYSRKILQKLTVTSLRMGRLYSLNVIGQIRNLNKLIVDDAFGVSDLNQLSNLKNLSLLRLDNLNPYVDLSAIGKLASLEELHLIMSESSLRDENKEFNERVPELYTSQRIDSIEALNRLRLLNVANFKNMRSLPQTAHLNRLQTVCLNNLKRLRNIETIGESSAMTEFHIGNMPSLTDYSPIARLNNLQRLSLYKVNMYDVSFLTEIPSLKHVYIDVSLIGYISALLNIRNIETINDIRVALVERYLRENQPERCFENSLAQYSANFRKYV